MMRVYRRILAALCLLVCLPAGALALTGQNISTFQAYYKENVTFLNENTGRHMLPVALETLELDNGRTQYSSYSDTLHVTIQADTDGTIETCEIRLLVPQGAQPGNSLYLDYVTANYHSLAFIMAMHVSETPESRYLLVDEIRKALSDNHGAYERQLNSYTISCVSVVGEGAVFTFFNNGLPPTNNSFTDGMPTPEPIEDDDEAANYG